MSQQLQQGFKKSEARSWCKELFLSADGQISPCPCKADRSGLLKYIDSQCQPEPNSPF